MARRFAGQTTPYTEMSPAVSCCFVPTHLSPFVWAVILVTAMCVSDHELVKRVALPAADLSGAAHSAVQQYRSSFERASTNEEKEGKVHLGETQKHVLPGWNAVLGALRINPATLQVCASYCNSIFSGKASALDGWRIDALVPMYVNLTPFLISCVC